MSFQMKNTGARVVLVHPTLLSTARQAAKAAGLSDSNLYLFSDTEHEPIDGIKDWRAMLGTPSEASRYQWPRLDGELSTKQIATVNYSSGTTGLPKGVMITHHNLIANVEQSKFMKAVEGGSEALSQERWIGFLPLYHAYGQLFSILMSTKLRTPVFIMSAFVFEDFLRIVQDQKITNLSVAPPILVMLSKHPATSKYDLSSVMAVGCGAAPLSKSLQNECSSRFNFRIGQGWGMTEVTCAGITVPQGFDDSTGSVGVALPNCECKLLDEKGNEVAIGQRGEIFIRGPNVSLGYWKNEKATKESMLEGGWLRTGDVAICDEKGWFWIVDRLKVRLLEIRRLPPRFLMVLNGP